MGGVDVLDQMVAGNRVLRKTRKWWKTLFFDFVDLVVVNSYLLFCEHASATGAEKIPTHLEFREDLVQELANIQKDEDVPLPPVGCQKRRRSEVEFEEPHPPRVAPSTNRRNCVVCYR